MRDKHIQLLERLGFRERKTSPWTFTSPVPLPASTDDFFSFEEAQDFLRGKVEGDGADCPCCGKFVRAYARNLNATMARSLLWIVKAFDEDLRPLDERWLDVPNTAPSWLIRTNQHTTLRWWGLLERRASEDPKLKHSGFWRPTSVGFEFARGAISLPPKVMTYNGTVFGFSTKRVYIHDCLEDGFDYREIMDTCTADVRHEHVI